MQMTKSRKINQKPYHSQHGMYANSFILFSKQELWLLWPPGVEPSELEIPSLHIRDSNWPISDFVTVYFNDDLHAATGTHIKHAKFKNYWYLGAECQPILGGDPSFLPLEKRNMNKNSQTGWFLKPPATFFVNKVFSGMLRANQNHILYIRRKKKKLWHRTKVVVDKQRRNVLVGNWPRIDCKLR